MKKYSTILSALILGASMTFTGCGSDSDSNDDMYEEHEHEEQLLFFYDSVNKTLYTYDQEHEKARDENSNSSNNIDLSDKASAQMIYWPDETSGELVEKYMFLEEGFDINDGNLTYEDIVYIGHQDDEGQIHAHMPEEFNPDNQNYSDEVKAAKAAGLSAMNTYLLGLEVIKEEISEAISNEANINGALCNFFVPHHEEHEEGTSEEHEEAPHYAITTDGKVHVFMEGENGLEKHTLNITIDGVDECIAGESGFASAGDHGVYVYSNDSKALHLIDEHGGNYHQHGSPTLINEMLPTGIGATHVIGVGVTGHSH